METEKNLIEMGYKLPEPPARAGVYMPVKEFGANMVVVSGCIPIVEGVNITGRLGGDCSFNDGLKAAEQCTLNILANLKKHLGDLDRIKSCVKMTVFVSCTSDFYQHAQIANAATELLVKIMGEEKGCPARAAIGVQSLPLNAAVEIELMAEIS